MGSVTFLGTGGAFSAGRRSNLALLVEHGDFRMLVEAGPPIMQQLARIDLPASEMECVFVSHSHGDHTLGFPMLALNRLGAPTPIHVYAGPHTIATLKKLCALAYPTINKDRLSIRWHPMSDEGPDGADLATDVTLRTQPVPHPPGIPTLAARWEFAASSISFVTDTFQSATAVELARGSDLLIHEASFSATLQPDTDPAVHFHTSAHEAGEIARQAGCPRLVLMHLGPEIGDRPDVLIKEARAGTDLEVIVPEDGERVSL